MLAREQLKICLDCFADYAKTRIRLRVRRQKRITSHLIDFGGQHEWIDFDFRIIENLELRTFFFKWRQSQPSAFC